MVIDFTHTQIHTTSSTESTAHRAIYIISSQSIISSAVKSPFLSIQDFNEISLRLASFSYTFQDRQPFTTPSSTFPKMKTSVVLGAVSAGLVTAEMLSPPANFPACGTTCFGNMLSQAPQLGCGSGGTTGDAVDGACLCKNIDFSYGIIDCANESCPQGAAPSVIQYGLDWCAQQGVVVGGLSATPNPSVASSASATISATGSSGSGGSESGTSSNSGASPITTSVIYTSTNSDGSTVTTAVETTISSGSSESSGTGGIVVPVSTTEIIATSTNSDGAVVTTTATSTVFSTSDAASGSGTESQSATDSGSASSTVFVTESTITASGSTLVTSVTTTAPVSSTEGSSPSTTESHGGSFQTAAPVGLVAAAGLAVLML
ncbi:hypothetical protein F4860DRAFT_460865 [Xylaria cubensis]|nr:hypothetical protein F4860DRAFT_460865 [Xylaria cubensis]